MKKSIKTTTITLIRTFLTSSLALLMFTTAVFAAPLFRTVAGPNPASIQPTIDLFRADLGGVNNGIGNSFPTGRREINWDTVPDINSAPNFLVHDFFNVNSPRGVVFMTPNNRTADDSFIVSANAASGTLVRFGNIDPSYSATFQTFSAERLFTVRTQNILEIRFFIPGTNIPATVSGFGAVLTDVDTTATSFIRCLDIDGSVLSTTGFTGLNNGLSFVGVSFNAGERIATVQIIAGNTPLATGNVDGVNGVELAAMDDFIYSEPRALEYHASDFDGDGTTDFSVFRPSNGTWFVLNSGTNTFTSTPFGQNGDIPVEGDFDGDSRSDVAVFRPGVGTWFILKSSNGQFTSTQFGQNGDRPVPGDYDKDGKTDISVFRPATGQWFTLRSSDGAFQATQWGQNLDIPIPASAQ